MARIDAAPFAYDFPRERTALVVIDMQRDFLEPGGFGAALGTDVSRLRAILPATRRLLDGCRAGIKVLHTRECHAPDLSDCLPAKRERGAPALRIGDAGPMGRTPRTYSTPATASCCSRSPTRPASIRSSLRPMRALVLRFHHSTAHTANPITGGMRLPSFFCFSRT